MAEISITQGRRNRKRSIDLEIDFGTQKADSETWWNCYRICINFGGELQPSVVLPKTGERRTFLFAEFKHKADAENARKAIELEIQNLPPVA